MQTNINNDLTLSEKTFREIRNAIIRCEIQPGEKLRVEELSERYQVSSSPVREALTRLSETSFVQAIDNKGFRSSELSIHGIQDLTKVRLLIETEALREAVKFGGDLWESNVVAHAHALSIVEKRLEDSPLTLSNEWSEKHRNFHISIYSGNPSKLLNTMVIDLFDSAERYRRFSAIHRLVKRKKDDEHQQFMKAVINRDTDLATNLLRNHISNTESSVIDALERLEIIH